MSGISKITQNVLKYGLEKPLDGLTKLKPVKLISENYRKDNTKFIAGLGIASIVLKDGLGCYLYVKQSLNNKKIPSDKRKFVAALDMTNGGLMILMQILMFKTISSQKVQDKLFNGLFGKYFDRAARKGYQAIIKNQDKFTKLSGKDFNITFEAFRKKCSGTLGVLTSLVAATIIAKRVIVPFIATPLADYAKKYMSKNDKDNDFSPEAKNTYDTKGAKLDVTEKEETNLLKTSKNNNE